MAIEQDINRGKKVCRDIVSTSRRRHSRIHNQAVEENIARINAIDGICGDCVNLILDFKRIDGRERVNLRCLANHSPMGLYLDRNFGEKVICLDRKPKSKV